MTTIKRECFGCSPFFSGNEKDTDRKLQEIISKQMKYTYVIAISDNDYLKISKYLGFMNSESLVLIGNTNWQSDRILLKWEITFFTDIDNIKGVFEYIERIIN